MKCSFLPGRQVLQSRKKNETYATHPSDLLNYRKSSRLHFCPLYSKSPERNVRDHRKQDMRGADRMAQARKLAEAIILQAIDDLWSPAHGKESIAFFAGEGFIICARLIGMGLHEKLRLIQFIKKAIQRKDRGLTRQSLKQAWG